MHTRLRNWMVASLSGKIRFRQQFWKNDMGMPFFPNSAFLKGLPEHSHILPTKPSLDHPSPLPFCLPLRLDFDKSWDTIPYLWVKAHTWVNFTFHRDKHISLTSLDWGKLPSWGFVGACINQSRTILVMLCNLWPALWSWPRHGCLCASKYMHVAPFPKG